MLGLFWFPYRQNTFLISLCPSSEGSWCYQEDFVEVSHGEQQHGVPNSQASLFLFVCLSVHVHYFGKLVCLSVCLIVFAKMDYNRLTTSQTQFLNNWFCSTGTCSTSRPTKKRWADVFFTFEIIFSPNIAAQIVSLDCLHQFCHNKDL